MLKNSTIFVAGTHALFRAALIRELDRQGYHARIGEVGSMPDLSNQDELNAFFHATNPDYVFYVGETSGGIHANQQYPADLMIENLLSQTNLIHTASRFGVKKLLFLGSSCSYPKSCPQPMQVESLMSGLLEPTSEAYATAKLAGMAMIRAYRQQYHLNGIIGIPGDVFGPHDDFDLETAHVLPALMRKIHEAKVSHTGVVEVWGSGTPRRQFLYVDDFANACVFAMCSYHDPMPMNFGGSTTLSIRELVTLIAEIVGYQGLFQFNEERPDGSPIKALDSSKLLSMGWHPTITMKDALRETYRWFLEYERPSKEMPCKTLVVG